MMTCRPLCLTAQERPYLNGDRGNLAIEAPGRADGSPLFTHDEAIKRDQIRRMAVFSTPFERNVIAGKPLAR